MNFPTAMILAAGTGTRLRPLTDRTPKALLPFRGKPMLEHVIRSFTGAGFEHLVINVHHHAGQVISYLEANDFFGISIEISDEQELLMDTGGGILKARKYLDGDAPFLVHNVDIFSNIDLMKLYSRHMEQRPLATLAVTRRETSRNLLVNDDGLLCGWKNNSTGEEVIVRRQEQLIPVAFSGIHVIDPSIFRLLDRQDPFSITKAYLELSKNKEIRTWDHSGDTWIDMASPDHFSLLNN